MNIANVESTTGTNCVISTNIPLTGYVTNSVYTITVSSSIALDYKITTNDQGNFAGAGSVDTDPQTTSETYQWTATGSNSAEFRALCGSGGMVRKMWSATPVTVSAAAPTTTTSGASGASTMAATTATSAAATTATSVAATTTTAAAATGQSLQLLSGMTLSTKMIGTDSMQITITSTSNNWISVGFSDGSSISMTGSGNGADVFACSNGQVKRYWVTIYSSLGTGSAVTGSSCSFISGVTTMTFQRKLAAQSSTERAITPGTPQQVIYAQGSNGQTGIVYHDSRRGGMLVDLASLSASTLSNTANAKLFVHLIFMCLSWGALLPWGAALANRGRNVPNVAPGAWFQMHRILQTCGLAVQVIGFAVAVAYVQDKGGEHFASGHKIIGIIVFLLGLQQPLNAFVRPHPPKEGESKSAARLIFEIVHKGVGWFTVLLGIFNVWYGEYLLVTMGFDNAAIIVGAVLAATGTGPVLLYFVLALIVPNNPCSRGCLRLIPKPAEKIELTEKDQGTAFKIGLAEEHAD